MKWDEYLAIHEVYYDQDGKPDGVTEKAKGIIIDEGKNSLSTIKTILEQMMESVKEPILHYDTLKEIDKEQQNEFSKSIKNKKENDSEDSITSD